MNMHIMATDALADLVNTGASSNGRENKTQLSQFLGRNDRAQCQNVQNKMNKF